MTQDERRAKNYWDGDEEKNLNGKTVEHTERKR